MTTINLCNIPFLDNNYSNVIDFSSVTQRRSYFTSKTLKSIQGNIKYDAERTYININLPIQEAKNYDYLWYVDDSNNYYFYFINNIEFVTPSNCNLFISLDVWSTYYFDFSILESFVDRCHVRRWDSNGNPTENNEDEGLFYGEIIQQSKEKICDLDKGIVITASSPIGKIDFETINNNNNSDDGNYDGTTGGAPGDWENAGTISADCLVMCKRYEGFVEGAYDDGYGYATIGYGITKHGDPEEYARLLALVPLEEEEAAKSLYNRMNGSSYAGYVREHYCDELGITKQCEYDALALRVYNCGAGSITPKLKNAILSGDAGRIQEVWASEYIYSNQVYVPALKTRRQEEAKLFTDGTYRLGKIVHYNTNYAAIGYVQSNGGKGWIPTTSTEESTEGES